MRLIQSIKTALQLRKYLKQLETYDYQKTYRELGFVKTENEYLLQDNQFNRGRQYVKSFGLMGLSFEKLINRKLSSTEIERIILLSHIAPVYDDLFDKFNTDKQQIIKLLKNPSVDPENDQEVIFLLFYRPLFMQMKQKTAFLDSFLQLTEAQENSKKQLIKITSKNEILDITTQKGGFSALLLFSLLDVKNNNEKGIYQLGACCQYMDDIFDWHDDSSEDRKTIANSLSLAALQQFYLQQVDTTITHFKEEPFRAVVKMLLTPGSICLDYYFSEKIDTTQPPISRIICDMESLKNVRKLLFNSYNF